MKELGVLFLCVWSALILSCAASSEKEGKNGFIFTCPKSLKYGATNELTLQRCGNLAAGVLMIKVLYTVPYSSNELLATEKSYNIEEGAKDSFLELFLEPFETNVYYGKIIINGTFRDYVIGGKDKIYFSKSKDNFVLIQTDKPLYKEGQTVKFRVLRVDKNLKPVTDEDAVIWVENPQGTRLFQWKNETLDKGIKQYEFPLADESVKGDWKISAFFKGKSTSIKFEVKEYVLPKFEVKIEIPSYVLSNAEEVPITICAKYTYGKPVKGNLFLNTSVDSSHMKIPALNYEGKIDGCFEYKINISLAETYEYYIRRRIQIIANVEESGTGVQRNDTQYIQPEFYPLNLNFIQEHERQFYKPGLPFNGKLAVNNPDNTPAPDEGIQICYTVSRERILSNWWASKKVKFCKNYTSDANGLIEYILPPQSTDTVGITINAISMKYIKDSKGRDRQNSLKQPEKSISLSPWFSPSGSFIQLQPVRETLFCGGKKSFKLLFTFKAGGSFKFHYKVLTQRKVVKSGVIEQLFSVDDDVSSQFEDEDKLVNDKVVQIRPSIDSSKPPPPEEECPSAKEARYVPPIGEVDIDIDVDASWSPSFHLLVYYIRDDRETIADSQKFKVEKCFKNQVKMQFGDAVKQPATKTSIRVSASPNSLCGIKIVDKSISLLNSDDQLTKDKIFTILESLDTGRYHRVNNHCNGRQQPGLSKSASPHIIRPTHPPRRRSSTSYEDSLAAFENTGLSVMSDFVLFTRPCKSRGGNGNIDSTDYAMPHRAGVMNSPTSRRYKSRTRTHARPPPEAMPGAVFHDEIKVSATKSVVDIRNYFPETWLFDMEMTGPDGEFATKEKLPHTITEWVGSAVCINDEDGLGISNQTSIKGFQAFFLSVNLPYSVIRGESFWITLSVFSYVEDALPIKVSLDKNDGFQIKSESIDGVICIQPGSSTNLKIQLKATDLGKQNITFRAESAPSSGVCGDSSVSNAVAKDAIENSVIVEAEGWPEEKIESFLFCPKNEENGVFLKHFSLTVPDDIVPDSARAFLDCTGNVLGKSLDNLESLVVMPTGCGEQNMVKFAPNVNALTVLIDTNQLTDKLRTRIYKNLNTGAQRQLNYKHPDGSFSAFGIRDKEGSMFLTAFVLRYFSEAAKYITIDNNTLVEMQTWMTSKQQANGCFPDVGKIIHRDLQGNIGKDKSQGTITAYVLASLLISNYQNQTVLDSALHCIQESPDKSLYATFLHSYSEALAGKEDVAKARIAEAKERVTTKGNTEFYHDLNATKSTDVETSAYAVLAILNSGGRASDALPIVQYLTQNMNPFGGFYSTQDTCVGLEALGEFAKLTFKDPVDINIKCTGGLEEEIDIKEDEKLVLKRNKISEVPSEVNVEGKGTGCAVIQKVLRYNTKTPPGKRSFKIAVSGECLDDKCKRGSITTTVSYIPEGKKTGMALVEVKMISGMVPVKETLEKLLEDPNLGLKRYDVENNVVVCYFMEITNSNIQFSFEVKEVIAVENSQPGSVVVYDYYNRDISSATSYSIGNCEDSSSCSKKH